VPNYASDILVNVASTKIPLISISFSSLVLIFVLVLVSSTIIQNVLVIFVIVFVVVDEKHRSSELSKLFLWHINICTAGNQVRYVCYT